MNDELGEAKSVVYFRLASVDFGGKRIMLDQMFPVQAGWVRRRVSKYLGTSLTWMRAL